MNEFTKAYLSQVLGTTFTEKKTSYNVVMTNAGAARLGVIKTLKDLSGLGLKELKDLTENLPKVVMSGLDRSSAESIIKHLEDAGASVEIK